MRIERGVSLREFNTFGLPAQADRLVRGLELERRDDLVEVRLHPQDRDVLLRAPVLDDGGVRVRLRPVEPNDELGADLEALGQEVRGGHERPVSDVERGAARRELARLGVGERDDADRLLIRGDVLDEHGAG